MTLALLISIALSQAPIKDERGEYSFVVPKGYEVAAPPAGTAHLLQHSEPRFAVLSISAMGGTIGREAVDPTIVEREAKSAAGKSDTTMTQFRYEKTRWKSFDVDLVLATAERQGVKFLTLTTQVPLRAEAVQVVTLGFEGDEAGLRADHQALVASIKGESSWLTDAERGQRLGRFLGAPVGIAVVLWWLRRRKNS